MEADVAELKLFFTSAGFSLFFIYCLFCSPTHIAGSFIITRWQSPLPNQTPTDRGRAKAGRTATSLLETDEKNPRVREAVAIPVGHQAN
jgi:hypothetical protein